MKKYANIGGWAGLALIIIGLVIYSINSLLTTSAIICMSAGVAFIIAYVVLKFNELKVSLSSRSARFGSNAALVVIFVLGILIVINILASKFSARVDTTASKLYSLAAQTEKVLKNMDKDVKVIGFFKSGNEGQARELLTEYKHFTERLDYEFHDPDKNPGLAKSYNIQTYGTVVVESQGKRERVNNVTEEDLTNAIISVTREGVKKVYFTKGHGERDYDATEPDGMSTAKEFIRDENYELDTIMLAEADSDIPDDCSVLVIARPQTDLFAHEQEKIKNYLQRGGKVMMLLDPESPASYASFLNDWGLNVEDGIVVDASGVGQLFGAGPTIPIVSQYASHVITKNFSVMTFFPEARPVMKADDAPADITVEEIAKTSGRSWAEKSPLTTEEIAFNEGMDIRGPISVFSIAEKDAENQPEQNEDEEITGSGTLKTRLAVFGDSDFASNQYFKVQGNKDLFMNALSWLAEEEDLISVRPRSPEDRRLNITQKQSKLMLYVGVILLPLAVFMLGAIVYRRRK